MPAIFWKAPEFDEAYNEIFNPEDFAANCENLSRIMRMIGWKWTFAKNEYPTAEEIMNSIRQHYEILIESFENSTYEELANGDGTFIVSTGGYTLTLYYNLKKRNIHDLTLSFDVWGFEVK